VSKLSAKDREKLRSVIDSMICEVAAALKDFNVRLAANAQMERFPDDIQPEAYSEAVLVMARSWGEALAREMPDSSWESSASGVRAMVVRLGVDDMADEAIGAMRDSWMEARGRIPVQH